MLLVFATAIAAESHAVQVVPDQLQPAIVLATFNIDLPEIAVCVAPEPAARDVVLLYAAPSTHTRINEAPRICNWRGLGFTSTPTGTFRRIIPSLLLRMLPRLE